MEYKTYITNRRAKIQGIGGYVNLPYGTEVSVDGRFSIIREDQFALLPATMHTPTFLRMTMGMEFGAEIL